MIIVPMLIIGAIVSTFILAKWLDSDDKPK